MMNSSPSMQYFHIKDPSRFESTGLDSWCQGWKRTMMEIIHSLSLSSCQESASEAIKQDSVVAVRSLTDLSAQVIAQNLERYDPQVLTPDYIPFSMAALIVRWLRTSADGQVALGNWAWFASQFGGLSMNLLEADLVKLETTEPPCRPSPFVQNDTRYSNPCRSSVARHRVAQIQYEKVINSLLTSPPSCPLLKLNIRSTQLITSLCLSDTMFGDSHALALKELRFLTILETERTNITDLGVYQLASALYRPSGIEERRGLYRLVAWSLNGCKGVTDRSTKRLVEWDYLNYLDLRQTSCVFPTYLRILNRHLSLHPSSPSLNRWKMSPAPNSSLAHTSLLQTIIHTMPDRLGSSFHETSCVSLHIRSVNSIASSLQSSRSRPRLPFNEQKEDDCVLVRTISPASLPGLPKADNVSIGTNHPMSKKRNRLSAIDVKSNHLDPTLAKKRPRKMASSSRKTGSILDDILLDIRPVQPVRSGKTDIDSGTNTKTSSYR